MRLTQNSSNAVPPMITPAPLPAPTYKWAISHALPLLHLIQFSEFVEKSACLCRVCDPSCGASETGFEVVGAGREELVADVQRLASVDAAEEALAG